MHAAGLGRQLRGETLDPGALRRFGLELVARGATLASAWFWF